MVKNMTEGNPARLLSSFALPVLMGGLVQQGYILIDAIIVGRAIGVEAFAAIGAVGNIDGLFTGFGMMMLQGYGVAIAQQFGAGQEGEPQRMVALSFLLTAVAACLLAVLSVLTLVPFMRLLQTPPQLMADGRRYMTILLGCMPVTLLTHMAYAALRALGNSRTPFACMVISSGLNIALDVLFVAVLGFGIQGAAAASIWAQLLVWPWIARSMRGIAPLRLRRCDFHPEKARVLALLRLGLPIALQNAVALVGVLLLQAVVNGFGVMAVAAYTAAMRIFFFMKEPAIALGHAIGVFTGQNIGAKDRARVRDGVKKGSAISLSVCAVAMVLMIFLGGTITSWVVSADEAETIALARQLLNWFAAMLPVLYLMYALRATLQGLGKTGVLFVSGIAEMIMRTVFALTLPAALGFACGVGIAETSAWLGALLLYIPVYRRWVKK